MILHRIIRYEELGPGCEVCRRATEAIYKLCLSIYRTLALELVTYGCKMILDKWSPDRIVEMHLEYYEEILVSSGMPGSFKRSL